MAEPAQPRGPSQATTLVEIGRRGTELFHDGDIAYGTFKVGDHLESHRVASKGFRQNLARKYHRDTEKAANADAVGSAIATLIGYALHEGKQRQVFLRVAPFQGKIYVDLANDRWEVIEVSTAGWRVIESKDAPVRFRRTPAMRSLPVPQRGGSIETIAKTLRSFVNVGSDSEFVLILAWLVAALRGRGPFAILLLTGAKDASKSTLARLLRALIDPNVADLRAEPTDIRNFAVAIRNCYLQALDNISFVEPWLSDCFCRTSTGGAIVVRGLYTDDDEFVFEVQCPTVLTGITEILTRDDALDRTINLYLPAVDPKKRKTEDEFWKEFNAAAPQILGVLLDAVSRGLHDYPNLKLPALPRLADFSRWAAATMPGLGYTADDFIQAYAENRRDSNALVLEVSAIATHVMNIANSPWCGTATALLEELNRRATDAEKKRRAWPKSGKAVSNQLRHIVGNLKAEGIYVAFIPRKAAAREIIIDKIRDLQDA